jgi:anti-sigma B factor antagonist
MEKALKQESNQTIMKPGRDIVASFAQELKRDLCSLMEAGTKELVIDLESVRMIDSIGLGVLIATHNSLKKGGGHLTVTNASKDIFGLFKTMRLDRHFDVKMAG